MKLTPNAFSSDGFLVRQPLTRALPFGGTTSDRNGCGWIAAYNLLRAAGRPVTWQSVYRGLNHFPPVVGRLGVNLFVLMGYLAARSCPLRPYVGSHRAEQAMQAGRAGILFYDTGAGNHYVTVIPLENGTFRFLNVNSRTPEVTLTLAEFRRRFVRVPLLWAVTSSGGQPPHPRKRQHSGGQPPHPRKRQHSGGQPPHPRKPLKGLDRNF